MNNNILAGLQVIVNAILEAMAEKKKLKEKLALAEKNEAMLEDEIERLQIAHAEPKAELRVYKRFNVFKNGKIYKVVNTEDDRVYIGCTYQDLEERWAEHRKAYRHSRETCMFHSYMKKLGRDKFRMELVKLAPCISRWHLENAEYAEQIKIPPNRRLFVPKKRIPYGLSIAQKRFHYQRNHRRRPSRRLSVPSESVQSSETSSDGDPGISVSIIPRRRLTQSTLHRSWFSI